METTQALVLQSCTSVWRIPAGKFWNASFLPLHWRRGVHGCSRESCKTSDEVEGLPSKEFPAARCVRVGSEHRGLDREVGKRRAMATLVTSLGSRRNLMCGCSNASRWGWWTVGQQGDTGKITSACAAAEVNLHRSLRINLGRFKRGVRTEAWLARHNEEGDWQYSPEWWGTQGGGWGRNAGDVVFESQSAMGNGIVSVTSHPASAPRAELWSTVERELHKRQRTVDRASRERMHFQVLGYEWRVLRFNMVTRQSVAKVMAVHTKENPSQVFLIQQPNCIAFEYVKSMISVGLSTMSLAGFNLEQVAHKEKEMRILCIGLGGGSLPLFLAHNLPGATLDVIEIDGAVITAAIKSMGFPHCQVYSSGSIVDAHTSVAADRSDMGDYGHTNGGSKANRVEHDATPVVLWGSAVRSVNIYEADGEGYVSQLAQQESENESSIHQYYDMIFVDAYDGNDVVPTSLWARDGSFLTSLSQLLHPKHGTVVVNLHTDSPPPSLLEKATGQYGPGFDPSLPQGRRVQEACWSYRDTLLSSSTGSGPSGGVAFTVAVSSQGNISLVVSRGLSVQDSPESLMQYQKTKDEQLLIEKLKVESKYVQKVLNSQVDFSKHVSRGFHVVQQSVKKVAKIR